jgi:hypothetical protein
MKTRGVGSPLQNGQRLDPAGVAHALEC